MTQVYDLSGFFDDQHAANTAGEGGRAGYHYPDDGVVSGGGLAQPGQQHYTYPPAAHQPARQTSPHQAARHQGHTAAAKKHPASKRLVEMHPGAGTKEIKPVAIKRSKDELPLVEEAF